MLFFLYRFHCPRLHFQLWRITAPAVSEVSEWSLWVWKPWSGSFKQWSLTLCRKTWPRPTRATFGVVYVDHQCRGSSRYLTSPHLTLCYVAYCLCTRLPPASVLCCHLPLYSVATCLCAFSHVVFLPSLVVYWKIAGHYWGIKKLVLPKIPNTVDEQSSRTIADCIQSQERIGAVSGTMSSETLMASEHRDDGTAVLLPPPVALTTYSCTWAPCKCWMKSLTLRRSAL